MEKLSGSKPVLLKMEIHYAFTATAPSSFDLLRLPQPVNCSLCGVVETKHEDKHVFESSFCFESTFCKSEKLGVLWKLSSTVFVCQGVAF